MMDDVDQIVLSNIKGIGYNIDSNITNLKQCSIEELVSIVFYCLNTIRPDLKLPSKLPPSMTLKFKICTEVANICKDLRYKGDVGYHTFLYNNRTDIKNVLLFLIEQVPRKVTYEEIEKTENKNSATIRQKTVEKLKEIHAVKSKDPYGFCNLPFISVELETGTLLPNQKIDCKPLEWRDFVIQKLPFIDEQIPDYQYLLPSLISLNTQGLLNPTKKKHSQFSMKPLGDSFFRAGSSQSINTSFDCPPFSNELPESADTTCNNIPDNTLPSLDNPESEIENERTTLESEKINLKKHISELSNKINYVKRSNEMLQKTLDEKETHESTLKKALMLLSDSEDSIPKLLNANDKCRNKMSSLEQQWKKHKEMLSDRHEQLKTITDKKMEEKHKITQNILEIRKELFNLTELIEKRDTKNQKLSLKERSIKGVQRGEYIQRILEIVKNIKKQDVGIEVILSDTRIMQKDINTISGKIERSYTATTQMLLSNPRLDDFALETHQLLQQIHTDISDILNMIGETGQLSREIKDLEEHVSENSEDLTESLKQVSMDLQKIKESQALFLDEIDKLTKEKQGVLDPSQRKPEKKQVSTTVQVQAFIEKCEDDISHPLAS